MRLPGRSLGQLQEAYTNAFDLRPDCTPNLGYHLFGDDGRRGLFLAELKGRMEARGIPLGFELPDHISLLLRYLDAAEEERALSSRIACFQRFRGWLRSSIRLRILTKTLCERC